MVGTWKRHLLLSACYFSHFIAWHPMTSQTGVQNPLSQPQLLFLFKYMLAEAPLRKELHAQATALVHPRVGLSGLILSSFPNHMCLSSPRVAT